MIESVAADVLFAQAQRSRRLLLFRVCFVGHFVYWIVPKWTDSVLEMFWILTARKITEIVSAVLAM